MKAFTDILCKYERQSTPLPMQMFQHWSFLPPFVLFLFLAAPLCLAQSSCADKGSKLSDVQTFQRVEDRWSQAIIKHDQYALELVLSPELIDISASGEETIRNQQIAMLFEKKSAPLSLDQRVINVRRLDGVTLVIGTYTSQQRVNGKLIRQKGKFTHVYQKVHSKWLCVSAHRTAEVEPVLRNPQSASRQDPAEHIIASACQSAQ